MKSTHALEVLRQTSPGVFANLSSTSTFILNHGWTAATKRHYAAAVNRYFQFMENTQHYPFPTTADAMYDFVCWCTTNKNIRTVLSDTTKRYLTGIRMWHVLHNVPFPDINHHRVRLLLKAAKVTQTPPTPTRTGFTLMDVHRLIHSLDNSGSANNVLRALILVGFWGLARLGELTLSSDHPDVFIRRKDVSVNATGSSMKIRIRLAKTASPGEIQLIHLRKQPNELDPISAVMCVLHEIKGGPADPLFPGLHPTTPISRNSVISFFEKFKPEKGLSWSGHSLRIGGASLRAHCGCSVRALKKAGRWKSSAYKLYVRPYDKKTAFATDELARTLRSG